MVPKMARLLLPPLAIGLTSFSSCCSCCQGLKDGLHRNSVTRVTPRGGKLDNHHDTDIASGVLVLLGTLVVVG